MPIAENILKRYLTETTPSSLNLHELREDLHMTPSLSKCFISSLSWYQDGAHEFLILNLSTLNLGEFWMRMERTPERRSWLNMSSSKFSSALDTYQINYDLQLLMPSTTQTKLVAKRSQIAGLYIHHMPDLISVIYDVAPKWKLTGTNCRWFCAVMSNVLSCHFHGAWEKKASNKFWEFRSKDKRRAELVRTEYSARKNSAPIEEIGGYFGWACASTSTIDEPEQTKLSQNLMVEFYAT